ncbi:MAG TPA: aldolase/citrate lyase family protein [Phototrophicaceae bacterium]|nr:aldolase/citrate lyase family protein [Phototrophicaceae bacterium]
MRENHALAQLRQGKPSIGLWLQSGSVNIARIIAAQGWFDWLLVDMEHSPVDLSTTALMLGAIADISAGQCTPLARVPHRTMYHIKQALDAGAQGIIVPMVSTAEEAAEVVRFARYPPEGERGAGGVLARYSFGTTSQPEYLANANREIMVGIQIETRAGVENIETILAVPGLDLIFIGPNDLHLSLGLVPSLWSEQPAFLAAVDQVAKACRVSGKPLGTLARNAEGVNARLASGFTMMGMSSDLENLLRGLDEQRKQIR